MRYIRRGLDQLTWKLALAILALIIVLIAVGILLMSISENALGLLEDPKNQFAAYVVVFAMVYGDAVIAVLPGETSLNVASVLAADDKLDLWPIIIAGGLGAALGDNTLYWIVRSIPGIRSRVEELKENESVKKATDILGESGPVIILFCRYLPGVRFAVTASMGAIRYPYRSYLTWSVIGGFVWATYTCVMAFIIGTALDEFPVASVVMAGASSGIIVAFGYFVLRRRAKRKVSETSQAA
jgi:membrane protein DedA with SNARE-associated domain